MPTPRLSDALAADADLAISDMGELVGFRPYGGNNREIYAMIRRETIAAGTSNARATPSIVATFLTSEASGINPATLDFERSKVFVAYIKGGESKEFGFTKEILSQTPGKWKVRLR